MIKLSRLDGHSILVNEDFVEVIEEVPDTVVSFQNGHRLIVKDSIDEIISKINERNKAKYNNRK